MHINTCFSVPQFEIAVIGSTEELVSSIVKAYIPNSFTVSYKMEIIPLELKRTRI